MPLEFVIVLDQAVMGRLQAGEVFIDSTSIFHQDSVIFFKMRILSFQLGDGQDKSIYFGFARCFHGLELEIVFLI